MHETLPRGSGGLVGEATGEFVHDLVGGLPPIPTHVSPLKPSEPQREEKRKTTKNIKVAQGLARRKGVAVRDVGRRERVEPWGWSEFILDMCETAKE